jgi:hypothetical protein
VGAIERFAFSPQPLLPRYRTRSRPRRHREALSAAIRRKDRQRRCDGLLDRLRTVHAPVAAAIADSPTDAHWTERLS